MNTTSTAKFDDATEGKSPYNENLLDAKNYKRIDDLL